MPVAAPRDMSSAVGKRGSRRAAKVFAEADLWRRYQETRDIEIRNGLAERHAGLVHDMARRQRRHLPAFVELDDLVSDGMLGLMDAVEKFDPDAGSRFGTYASRRIHGAMMDGIRERDWDHLRTELAKLTAESRGRSGRS